MADETQTEAKRVQKDGPFTIKHMDGTLKQAAFDDADRLDMTMIDWSTAAFAEKIARGRNMPAPPKGYELIAPTTVRTVDHHPSDLDSITQVVRLAERLAAQHGTIPSKKWTDYMMVHAMRAAGLPEDGPKPISRRKPKTLLRLPQQDPDASLAPAILNPPG